MSSESVSVLNYLTENESLVTRLREASGGDIQYFPGAPPAFAAAWPRPSEVIAVLEKLAGAGIVMRSEQVHPFDSAEYQITWQLARR